MPQVRLSMRKIREIIRLGLDGTISQRDIASSVGLSKTAVQAVLQRAKQIELSLEDIGKLGEFELSAKLYPPPINRSRKHILPDWCQLSIELRKKGVTLHLLWHEYKAENPNGLQYSRFCTLYREWEKTTHLVMRQTHKAGEKLFIDFSGLTIPWLNLDTNEVQYAEVFVAVLGASNYTFVYAVENQTLPNWVKCHVNAFEFFAGIPEILVPDNLKSGVTKACKYEPDINPTYNDLAMHYNTAVIPARALKPRDKAKVEQGVQLAQRWILACFRHRTFTSISEINNAIIPLLDKLNNKTMRQYKKSRKELFLELDTPVLKSLPEHKFEFATWKIAKVNIDYHVEVDKHFYSVPYKCCGEKVDIRITQNTIEVFKLGELVSVHKRKNLPGRHTTIAEHMPSNHRKHAEWTPDRILNWAGQNGVATKELCINIIAKATHPEQGFRSCLGVIRMGEKYTAERLELACKRALKLKYPSYKSVKNILQNNLDSLEKTNQSIPITPQIEHENIRGSSYYN
jgi:transposase